MLALAHDVPDIAEHEEIAGDRAREACDIVGVAGDETGGKALGKMRGRVRFRDRIADALRQFLADGDVLCRARVRRSLPRDRHHRPPAPPRYSRRPAPGLFRRAELSCRSASSAARPAPPGWHRRRGHAATAPRPRRTERHASESHARAELSRNRLIPENPMFSLPSTWCAVFKTQLPRRKKGFSRTTRLCRICMSK